MCLFYCGLKPVPSQDMDCTPTWCGIKQGALSSLSPQCPLLCRSFIPTHGAKVGSTEVNKVITSLLGQNLEKEQCPAMLLGQLQTKEPVVPFPSIDLFLHFFYVLNFNVLKFLESFIQSMVTFDDLSSNPALLSDPKLVIRINDR